MAVSSGPVVVLTREAEDNQPLALELQVRGVPVLEIPCVATRFLVPGELPDRIAAVAFTSRRAVAGLLRLPQGRQFLLGDPRPLLCAVGPATAAALAEAGFPADIVADPPRGEALAKALVGRLQGGLRIALARGNLRAGEMDEALESAGFTLMPLVVYENAEPRVPSVSPVPVAAVFVASPSAGKRLLEANPWLRGSPFVAIGPTTGSALRALGILRVQTVAMDRTAWIDALCAAYESALRLRNAADGKEPN
jgi:uroporphyrinogen III methyltransferase/synthase